MSFVSALPANTVKLTYIPALKTIIVIDSGTGTDLVTSRSLTLPDTSTGYDIVTTSVRQVTDQGLGKELVAYILRKLVDSGVGVEKALTTLIRLLRLIDTAVGIDERRRREACITVAGIELCKILPHDYIYVKDHNNPVSCTKAILSKLEEVKKKLDEAKGLVGG